MKCNLCLTNAGGQNHNLICCRARYLNSMPTPERRMEQRQYWANSPRNEISDAELVEFFNEHYQRKKTGENTMQGNLGGVATGFAHERTEEKEEWLTPPEIIKALGDFDLDPCSPINRPWDTAKQHFTVLDDGLKQQWRGMVYCNPPYGSKTSDWMARMADHNNGVALIFARTETGTFFNHIWEQATAFLFIKGRLSFYTKEGKKGGTAGAPSVLIAYGDEASERLLSSGITGKFLWNGDR
jgi:DNA N-6-adenine-methyltransferase (Dam)